jgi:hypothetical protein
MFSKQEFNIYDYLMTKTAPDHSPMFACLRLNTEMSTRNIKILMFLGSKVRLVRRADNLTAIYEPIV